MSTSERNTVDVDARLAALKQPNVDPDCRYHAITLTADDKGRVIFGTYSKWVGWADEEMRHELRESRLVYADYVKIWQAFGLPYSFIHAPDELMLFLLGGGNALVEQNLAELTFPEMLKASPVVNLGPMGFASVELFEETAFRRAPTPKTRMQVLTRDDRRCRICGRRPDDNSDLELHVHHIRPWAKGGITDPSNLITLCHTCHNGLMPHEDHKLFDYLSPSESKLNAALAAFLGGVTNYRKVGFLGSGEVASQGTRRRRRPNRKK